MDALPTGVVTLVLTEVDDSIRRWEDDPAGTARAMTALDARVAATVARHDGVLVKPRGEGDSHFTAFSEAGSALAAAAELARADIPLRVAVHTGPLELRDGDYYGTDVNRCARLRAIAHPGQVVVSATAAVAPPPGLGLIDLGRHHLKDLARPEHVFQLTGPGLAHDFPPLRSVAAPAHGLPLPLTSFVGRASELTDVVAAAEPGRLVCVTGPPGVGKSRLALEAAAVLHDRGRVARLVGGDGAAPADVDVVVCDDADHRLDALPAAAGATLLVTSRTAAPGADTEVRLAPLSGGAGGDAVRLFVDRAGAVRADFDPGDAAVVADLCARLSGLPLAIELAAARTGVLTVAQLLARADRLDRVLSAPARPGPAHHRSLSDAVAWTLDALSDGDREALAALASGSTPEQVDSATVGRLLDRSWLEPGPDGPGMLDVLRPFLQR